MQTSGIDGMKNPQEDPLDDWYPIIGTVILACSGGLAMLAILGIWIQVYWLVVFIFALFFFGAASIGKGE
jgi:hypothetical protein